MSTFINIIEGHLPALIIVVFLLMSFITPIFDIWKRNWCSYLALFAHFVALGFIGFLTWKVHNEGTISYHLGGWPPPWGIEFVVDYLAIFMMITVGVVSTLILLFATEDVKHELKDKVSGWYYTLYLLLIASLMGLAVTNDFFNMFVFMEIGAISACGIISIKEDRACIEASLKYLILSSVGTGCVLLSSALLYMITGHLNFSFAAAGLETAMYIYPNNVLVALALFSAGLIVKAALFPLHVWLPDAHSSAPSPSSAVLSGLVIKLYAVVYIKLLMKVFPAEIFTWVPVLEIILILSSLSIFFGSIFAMVQDDIKRMLAFSSIAQIGYVFLGIGLYNHTGLSGGILHIFNHAMMKSMLFLSAGAIIYMTGIRKIDDLKGIGFKVPVAMGAFTVGAMAMVGIPSTNGFISKLHLALGSLEAGKPIYLYVILLSSFLNAVYYFPIVINAFFGEGGDEASMEAEEGDHKPLPLRMSVPLILLALGCMFFGVFPRDILALIERAIGLLL
ncbi:MAG: monovalent cation/H+ antiporter subunit D family protein [Candidatus Syntrophonatronum acetioxidans]|uniref:Monovalent cation/H+ antiporter subunit D family protein n=1 Tax=Candidatus Syntrophonatronum acetioxidans TaxID=1795816 RepID=A0A424YAY0_9FIRM|nr:MAG: monovalent cation/H+ antiporter subunit D family protein [Candidatus Syntrophonatronum acetioxidans]